MKKFLTLVLCATFIVSCTNKKKEEEKLIEQSIEKIDSLGESVQEGIQNLENAIDEAEEAVEALDNI